MRFKINKSAMWYIRLYRSSEMHNPDTDLFEDFPVESITNP